MKEKIKKFWKEYKVSTNWKYALFWFILFNVSLWNNWNFFKFGLLVFMFTVITFYLWATNKFVNKSFK